MPMNAQSASYNAVTPIVPLYDKKVLKEPVNLAPSTVFAKGTILGPVTSSANDVQTFTATGTPTGGTFTFTVYNLLNGVTSNLVIPFGATATVLQSLANTIFGTGNTVATGGPWPGTPLVLTGAGQLVGMPIPIAVAGANAFTGGSSPAASVAHTTLGRSAGTFAPYLSGNSDGSQVGGRILEYPCATDASGNVWLGNLAGASDNGIYRSDAISFISGYFRSQDLVGLDSNLLGLTPVRFVLISGTIASGEVELL